MEDTSGFYKLEDNNWQYAPNFVYGPNYELLKENKDSYTYPVEGWEWYDESPIEEEPNSLSATIDGITYNTSNDFVNLI